MSADRTENRLLPGETRLDDAQRFTPGQKVVWHRTTARGYGFIDRIHATVVSVGEKTVRIEAPLAKGGTKQTNVRPQNLVHA